MDRFGAKSLRIGFPARSLTEFRGGVDLYVDRLLRHLAPIARSAGHQVFALFDDPRAAERFAGEAIEADVVRIRGRGRLIWDHAITPAWCRSRRLDVVVCPRSFRPLALPCRSATVLYDLLYFDHRDDLPWWDHTYFRTLHRLSLHRSDTVFTFSGFTTSRLREWVPRLEPGRVHQLPPGPPHEIFSSSAPGGESPSSGLPLPARFLLIVGARPWKNVGRVIEAFARLGPDVDHSLVIASVWEHTRRQLEAQAAELGVGDRVLFLGRVALGDLARLYRGAEVFVYASLHEGIGIPPLEAMACGCPVVASSAASIPEVTAGAALLVDPLNVSSIVQGLRHVLLDPALRDALRRRGKERIHELSWEEVASRALERLEALDARAPDLEDSRSPARFQRS